jgi:methionyl-tRNA formyltransferase
MLEAVDLVRDGKAPRVEQDHSQATYESWCRKADAEIDWSKSAPEVYNLVRGTNPQPGAWTKVGENELKIFDCNPAEASGAPGEVAGMTEEGFTVACGDGGLLVRRVRPHDGGKVSAADYVSSAGLTVGARLGTP